MVMGNRPKEHVYIFHGDNARFTTSVYASLEQADVDIKSKQMSGMLTIYPLNETVYDYCVREKLYVKKENISSQFIQGFTSAYLEHYHYKDGCRDDQ